ncbi:MAG: peptide ABC transporter substrate-binding protein [Chloroflexota bacterium]
MSPGTRRSFAFGAAFVLAASVLTVAPVAAQDGDVPQGGTIVVGEWQRATQLNPYLSNALKDVEGVRPAMRPLAAVNDEGEFVPELLAEFPTVENGGIVLDEDGDGFTLNLVMQDGLAWSDGTPLTLNDYKWNYDWATGIGASGQVACPYCAQLVPLKDPSITGAEGWDPSNQRIDSFEVSEDGLTAAIHFEENFAGWITMLTEIYLLSPSFWGDVALEDVATAAAVDSPLLLDMPTSGPFKIVAAGSEGIDYEPNEFWAADDGPNLDRLRLRFFGSKDGMFAAFLAGEIDLTLNTTLADVAALQSVSPDIGRAIVDTGWQYEHVTFNHEASDVGLDDANVRRALAMAIDKQGLLDVLFPGAGLTPACSNAPPAQWYAAEGITCDPYDPELASSLLDEAGWAVDPDLGIRAKDGNPMRIRMCTSSGNPVRLTTLGRISQDWGAISVGTDIQTEDPSVYFGSYDETTSETDCNIYRGTFDIALYTDQLSPDPFSDWFTSYESSQPATDDFPSGLNIARVADPVLDELVTRLGSQMTEDGIKEVAAEVSQYVVGITLEAALYYRPEPTGIGNRLGGFEKKNPSTATSLWDVENWFVIP